MTPSLIIIVAAVAILLILLIMFFTYNNKEIYLRKEADAQRKKIESTHDKMWKVIKQKAEVSDKYRETFERVYPESESVRAVAERAGVGYPEVFAVAAAAAVNS